MSDPILRALWDAVEQVDPEEAAREKRIRESREARDRYMFGDPALHVPGRIDNQRSRKGKNQ